MILSTASGKNTKFNLVVVLGPTAVGKTSLGVKLARHFQSEIISADSRQVYKGLDLGSGKDLDEYTCADGYKIPYHIIDVTDLNSEYNVFDYQQDFYKAFSDISSRGILPIVVGGTGMYLDSFIRNYDLIPVPTNEELRKSLEDKTVEELASILLKLCPDFHTTADLQIRERLLRHIEIETFMQGDSAEQYRKNQEPRPEINPLIIGTTLPRMLLKQNIERRLKERFDEGMTQEVQNLHDSGFSWERLESLGLEYKFISEFLEGKIKTEEELFDTLNHAICQFAKRQETWFRGMEKKGVIIHWIPSVPDSEIKFSAALNIVNAAFSY